MRVPGVAVFAVIGGLGLWAASTVAVLTSLTSLGPLVPMTAASSMPALASAPAPPAASDVAAQFSMPAPSGGVGAGASDEASEASPASPALSASASALSATPEAIQVFSASGSLLTGPRGGPVNSRGADLYDCADFTSLEQMLAVFFASVPGDPNNLDPAGTGMPCGGVVR